VGDAVRFETKLTADSPRTFELLVHPEYDTASMTIDPKVLSIYVKRPEWVQVNGKATASMLTEQQRAVVKDAVSGGAYAFFNHQAGFGVEQRFDPQQVGALGLFWDPSRQQINLELTSKALALGKEQTATCGYEVRYLKTAPNARPAKEAQ
jgi:hypothetical protein